MNHLKFKAIKDARFKEFPPGFTCRNYKPIYQM